VSSETQTPDYHDPWVFQNWAAQLCTWDNDGGGKIDFSVYPRYMFPYQQPPLPISFGCDEALAADPVPGCEPPLVVFVAALVTIGMAVAVLQAAALEGVGVIKLQRPENNKHK